MGFDSGDNRVWLFEGVLSDQSRSPSICRGILTTAPMSSEYNSWISSLDTSAHDQSRSTLIVACPTTLTEICKAEFCLPVRRRMPIEYTDSDTAIFYYHGHCVNVCRLEVILLDPDWRCWTCTGTLSAFALSLRMDAEGDETHYLSGKLGSCRSRPPFMYLLNS
jgi:hypothetical protein